MYEDLKNNDSDSEPEEIEDPQKLKIKMAMKGFFRLMKENVL